MRYPLGVQSRKSCSSRRAAPFTAYPVGFLSEEHPTDPLVSYGIAKLAIEKYLHLYWYLHGLDYSVLRVANPYGERQRVDTAQGAVAVFLSRALAREPIKIWAMAA